MAATTGETATTVTTTATDDIVVWGDNEKRIKTIQGMFFGSLPEPLVKPGRVLVGEGVLLKQCRKKLKPRQFFLFNDLLLYADILVNKKNYSKPHFLYLKDISVTATSDEKAIQIFNPQRSFLVYTATSEEASEWIAHVNLCIKKLPTGERDTKANPAAIWIPDKDADNCMVCRSTKFTMLNRRHHCRQCGRVACGACTKQKYNLPPSGTPQRVCNACFSFLTSQGAAANTTGSADQSSAAAPTPAVQPASPTTPSKDSVGGANALPDSVDDVPGNVIPTGPTVAQQASHDPDDDDDDDDGDQTTISPEGNSFVSMHASIQTANSVKATDEDPEASLDAMFAFTHNARASVFFTEDQTARIPLAAQNS